VKFDKDFNQLKVTVEVALSTFVHENGEINDRVVDKTEESDEISPLYC
jgi:N12 class adenine-specific DNA methylase